MSASFGVFSLFFSLSCEVKVDERPAVEFKKLLDIDRVEPLMINRACIRGIKLTDKDDDENLLRSSGTAVPGAVADADIADIADIADVVPPPPPWLKPLLSARL